MSELLGRCIENCDLEELLTINKDYFLKIKQDGLTDRQRQVIVHEVELIADDGGVLTTLEDRFIFV